MKAQELRIGNSIKVNGDIVPDIGYGAIMDMYKKQKGIKNDYFNSLVFEPIPLTEEWLLKLGFEKIPYYTLANNLIKSLGNGYRRLAFADVGTPNEMLWIHDIDDDIVCLHNYDYNGYMTVHKLQNLFHALTAEELTLNPTQ